MLDASLDIENNVADVWLLKGSILLELEHLDNAVEAFDRVLALTPEKHTAWYRKGKAFAGLRDYPEAIRCFDRVIAMDPCLRWPGSGKAVPCSPVAISGWQ